jgi:sec-independent protein translocase protein TatA
LLHDLTILALLPLGGWELAVVAIVFMLLFYGKRLPDIGRNMGRSIVEFKKGLSSQSNDDKQAPTTPTQSEQESGKAS